MSKNTTHHTKKIYTTNIYHAQKNYIYGCIDMIRLSIALHMLILPPHIHASLLLSAAVLVQESV